MKKNIMFFLGILLISNNIFIFACGIYQKIKAEQYTAAISREFLLDSAYVLATHSLEDGALTPAVEKQVNLWEGVAGYSYEESADGKKMIKVRILLHGEEFKRVYCLK